jgi:hypothetical protein
MIITVVELLCIIFFAIYCIWFISYQTMNVSLLNCIVLYLWTQFSFPSPILIFISHADVNAFNQNDIQMDAWSSRYALPPQCRRTSLMNFVVSPPGCDQSVTDFWGLDTPDGAVMLSWWGGWWYMNMNIGVLGGGFNILPAPNSELLTKLSRIPSSVENTSITT